jgi:hypothetical protein
MEVVNYSRITLGRHNYGAIRQTAQIKDAVPGLSTGPRGRVRLEVESFASEAQ